MDSQVTVKLASAVWRGVLLCVCRALRQEWQSALQA